MIYVKKIATALSLVALLASVPLYANSSTATEVSKKSGVSLLKNSYQYLGSLKKYAFTADVTNTLIVDGGTILTKRVSQVKVERPDKFKIDNKGEFIDRSFYLSNGHFSMIDNEEKYYATVDTGGDIDKTLDMINKKLGIVVPLSTLLHSDMNKFIHPRKVQYFGTREVGGVSCDYIAFRQGNNVVHMWIEDSDKPLVRAAKVIRKTSKEQGTTDMVIKWDTTPSFSSDVFVFKAPKGASNVSIRPAK